MRLARMRVHSRRPSSTSSLRMYVIVAIAALCGFGTLKMPPSPRWLLVLDEGGAVTASTRRTGTMETGRGSLHQASSPTAEKSRDETSPRREDRNAGPGAREDKPGGMKKNGNVRVVVAAATPKHQGSAEFYSEARTDRSGASINHMLLSLAHGYDTNTTYMGACYQKDMVDGVRRQADKEALIKAVGLENVLRFACPPPNRKDLILVDELATPRRRVLFTPEFMARLRSVAKPIPLTPGGLAVVHVRRGDIDPCRPLMKKRYLPTSYYVDVLKRYVPVNVPVVVYSEAASFEPFTEIEEYRRTEGGAGVTLRLDTDVAEVWEAIMAASHVVVSRSSFTYVPTLLNVNATLLYPPDSGQIHMPYFTIVEDDIMKRSARRVDELEELRCHNYTSVKAAG